MKNNKIASNLLSFSPSMAPANNYPQPQQQDDEIMFLRDKNFELHGEIMMFVLVAIFFLFILFLIMLPCLRQPSNHEPEYSDSVAPKKCPLPWLRKRRRIEDVTTEGSLQLQGETSTIEVNRKSPL